MKKAREYLHANLSEKVSLEELAKATGLSRYHLLRVFRKATGLPPHSYHLQQRIEHAKRLLRSGMPFAETALQSGFFRPESLHQYLPQIYRRDSFAIYEYLAGTNMMHILAVNDEDMFNQPIL